ncbi:hypothetical protein [Kineosporia babensis]|uniref:Uncharacterized protein n=1 Tax=Kineosporia babensis TaxID=499548 RepID=A0A9X1NCJ1_9ACTN|nr:hypothetical protein [Kineosporia babensis]MCD5311600.1 hypothetical protein [Kineosporia babensis]
MAGAFEVRSDDLKESAAQAQRAADLLKDLKPAFAVAGNGMPGSTASALLDLVQERVTSALEGWVLDESSYSRSLTRAAETYEATERAAAQEYARSHPLTPPQTYYPGVSRDRQYVPTRPLLETERIPGYRLPQLVERDSPENTQP